MTALSLCIMYYRMSKKSFETEPERIQSKVETLNVPLREVSVQEFAQIIARKDDAWQAINTLLNVSIQRRNYEGVAVAETLFELMGKAKMVEPLRGSIATDAPQLSSDFESLARHIYDEEEVKVVDTLNKRRLPESPAFDSVQIILTVNLDGKPEDLAVNFRKLLDGNTPAIPLDIRNLGTF